MKASDVTARLHWDEVLLAALKEDIPWEDVSANAVIDEDAERLTKDMEENPGIAISIGNKLTEILGLTGTANLKKL